MLSKMPAQAKEEEGALIRIEWNGGPVDWIMVVRDIIAYILFMHHQIPVPLDQLQLSTAENIVLNGQGEASSLPREQRERLSKVRATKREMKKRENLNKSIEALLTALKAAFQTLSYMPSVLLVLGSSTKQPRAVYDIQFHGSNSMYSLSQCEDVQVLGKGFSLETVTKGMSKRITRGLISEDGGPLFTGPMKLFLFVKADASSCLQDFFPKRGYTTQSRKVQAHLRVIQIAESSFIWDKDDLVTSSTDKGDSGYKDIVWFQCKFHVKGSQLLDAA